MYAYTRRALWGEHTHWHVCTHRCTVSSNTYVCAPLEQLHQCEQAWGQRHRSPCGPPVVLAWPRTSPRPPGPQPALPEPLHPLFLRHILSLCPFLNSVLPPGSAGTLLFSQLPGANSQGERKALLRGRVPDALSHRQSSPKGQSFPGSAGTVAVLSQDQLQDLPDWLQATANSPLRAGDTWVGSGLCARGRGPAPGGCGQDLFTCPLGAGAPGLCPLAWTRGAAGWLQGRGARPGGWRQTH